MTRRIFEKCQEFCKKRNYKKVKNSAKGQKISENFEDFCKNTKELHNEFMGFFKKGISAHVLKSSFAATIACPEQWTRTQDFERNF